jgi:hypothetical protein
MTNSRGLEHSSNEFTSITRVTSNYARDELGRLMDVLMQHTDALALEMQRDTPNRPALYDRVETALHDTRALDLFLQYLAIHARTAINEYQPPVDSRGLEQSGVKKGRKKPAPIKSGNDTARYR